MEKHVFNHEKNKIEIALDDADKATVFESLRHSDNNKDLCPYCGNSLGHVNYLRASATQMGRALATTILDNAEGVKNTDSEILYKGKKYITFTDNRQGSARTAMGLNQDVERAWIRASIFHKMADMRLERIEPSGLTDEEKQTYQYLSTQPKEALPPFLLTELERLEAKKVESKLFLLHQKCRLVRLVQHWKIIQISESFINISMRHVEEKGQRTRRFISGRC